MKTLSFAILLTLGAFAANSQNHNLVNMRVLQYGELLNEVAGEGVANIFPASLDSYDVSIRYMGELHHYGNVYLKKERVFQGHRIIELEGKDNLKVTLTYDEAEQLTTISVREGIIKTFTTDKIPPLTAANY